MTRAFIFLVLLLTTLPLTAQLEADYITVLARHLGGTREVPVTSGRVDILTDTYAIEVERAAKWKNSIGQSLWYGQQTLKKPGIILLIESAAERKYAIQLQSTIDYFGLTDQIKVWRYPDDFPGVTVSAAEPAPQQDGTLTHWLNLNGNKRHTSSCRWYGKTTRGRYCTATEGEPAGCCH